MSHWLYERIAENDEDRKPSLSVQATHNWFRALSFEIQSSHGKTNEELVTSCREFYKNVPRLKTQPVLGDIFEPLFFSVVYSMTLERFSNSLNAVPWIRPTVVVDWYYAIYFSIRSMFPVFGHNVAEDHSKTARFVASTFRTNLPYPLDMVAHREDGEDYSIFVFEKNPGFYDLNRTFMGFKPMAQGMLAQYLKGTADWYADRTKNKILEEQKNNFTNFRSKKAREIRDRRLTTDVGFLHCAFRQRVKANYRDAVYLSYNYGEEINLDSFTENLSTSAKFLSIMALAFVERKVGSAIVKSFVEDLDNNLRGVNLALPSEKYWKAFINR